MKSYTVTWHTYKKDSEHGGSYVERHVVADSELHAIEKTYHNHFFYSPWEWSVDLVSCVQKGE